jgi:ribosome-associated heat shock protein Hsp15
MNIALALREREAMDGPGERQRLDLWLVNTRFFKTRVLAAKNITGGHVKVDGERAKSGQKVKVGDRVEILRDRERFVVRVERLPERRGPAADARACYLEDPSARAAREALRQQLRQDRMTMPRTAGRPDKHTRRLLRQRNRDDQ